MSDRPATSETEAAPAAAYEAPGPPSVGPPWIGPIVSAGRYERQWLAVHVVMLASATVFFGWRGLFMASLTATMALGVFALISAPLRIVRGRWGDVRLGHVLNMGLLMGLTLPLTTSVWVAVRCGLGVGLLCYVTGPAHRLRVHPVALAHVLLVGPIVWLSQPVQAPEPVLVPAHVVVGDVWRAGESRGGAAYWINMTTDEPPPDTPPPDDAEGERDGERAKRPATHAVLRNDPSRLLLSEQKRMLANSLHTVGLLRRGEMPRLIDVLIGARPGPVGATSAMLLIVLGLWLMYVRMGRWRMTLIALAAAVVALLVMPVYRLGVWQMSVQCFADIGWQVSLAYMAFAVLASPLPLIILIIAPRSLPRAVAGRAIFALIVGAGVVAMRWFAPYEGVEYVPVVAAGLLCPLLDRMQRSPYVMRAAAA